MTKIFEVKGVKGLRKLMKEIAITASTGKHDNELIGRANIPLKVKLLAALSKNTGSTLDISANLNTYKEKKNISDIAELI